jgi:hypothetical protein
VPLRAAPRPANSEPATPPPARPQRKTDQETLRAQRAEEARQRALYNAERAAQANAMDEARREDIAFRLEVGGRAWTRGRERMARRGRARA